MEVPLFEFDDLLVMIANDIADDGKIDSLGKQLKLSPSEIERYIQTNRSGPNVTCRGTLRMLRDWNDKVPEADEREILKKALVDAKLVKLADKYLA